MSNNELYEHKRSDTVKWVLTLLAFILGGVMLAGIILGWFDKKEESPAEEEQQQTEEELPAVDENGEELEADTPVPMPKAMTFRTAASLAAAPAAQAEIYDSVTITATVKPDSAADKSVDWAIAFVNSSSEWATGKTVTDYVTVTPSSDGSTTATVKCLQPFGEQIKVTVTSRMNTEATASCTVDFAARPKMLFVSGVGILNNVPIPAGTVFQGNGSILTIDPLVANSSYLAAGGKYLVTSTPSVTLWGAEAGLTDHTVGDVTITDFTLEGKPTSGLVSATKAQGLNPTSSYQNLYISLPDGGKTTAPLLSCFYACGLEALGDGSTNVAMVNKLNTAILNNTSSNYDIDVRLTVETNVGTFEFNNKYKFDRAASVFGVESIQLNDYDIVI